jgi:hypothetical protein
VGGAALSLRKRKGEGGEKPRYIQMDSKRFKEILWNIEQ